MKNKNTIGLLPNYDDPLTKSVFRRVKIVNQRGLHARAAAQFSQLADTFDAKISIGADGVFVSAHSIMSLMMLTAGFGTFIEIKACGVEAKIALNALVNLIQNKFGED